MTTLSGRRDRRRAPAGRWLRRCRDRRAPGSARTPYSCASRATSVCGLRLRIAIESGARVDRRLRATASRWRAGVRARVPGGVLIRLAARRCPDARVARMPLMAAPPQRARRAAPAPHWRAHRAPSSRASVTAVGPSARRPVGASASCTVMRFTKVEQRQAAVGARVAVGRQHVIGAASSSRPWSPASRRRGTPSRRCAPCGSQLRGVAHLEDQVLGCVFVATPRSRSSRSRHHDAAAAGAWTRSTMSRGATARRICVLDLVEHRRGQRLRGRDQHHLRIVSCSACASRSAATNSGIAPSRRRSPALRTGPAGRSSAAPAGSAATSCLAAVTQALPGPKILSTLRTLAVPYAMRGDGLRAAHLEHACRCRTARAATSTAGSARPSRRGGVQMIAHRAAGDARRHGQHDGGRRAAVRSPRARTGRRCRSAA